MPRYTSVGSFPSRPMAELASTYLSANGIPAMVWADDAGGTHPYLSMYGGISLRVLEEDAEAARELLAQAEIDAAAAGPDEDDVEDRRDLRPVGKWIVRLAAAAVVAGAAISALPSRG